MMVVTMRESGVRPSESQVDIYINESRADLHTCSP